MAHDSHHEHLIKEIEELYGPVLSNSPQAIYIYLDDQHKTCNQKFAEMLGYESVKVWVDNEFALDDVAKEDQEKVVNAYMAASQNFKASVFQADFMKKDGKKIRAEVIMAPVSYKDEVFVIHFISQK